MTGLDLTIGSGASVHVNDNGAISDVTTDISISLDAGEWCQLRLDAGAASVAVTADAGAHLEIVEHADSTVISRRDVDQGETVSADLQAGIMMDIMRLT